MYSRVKCINFLSNKTQIQDYSKVILRKTIIKEVLKTLNLTTRFLTRYIKAHKRKMIINRTTLNQIYIILL